MNHGLPYTLGIVLGPGDTATEDRMLDLIQLSLLREPATEELYHSSSRGLLLSWGKGCSQDANKSKARPSREVGS